MRKAVCPGSFDPVTNGHFDIFLRAAAMFEELTVAVFHNPIKQQAMFSVEERVDMLKECTKDIPNVQVDAFSGLLPEYLKQRNTAVILRGLRALSDFEYEFQRALMIKKLAPDIETVFIMTSMEYSFLSSTAVRELLAFGASVSGLVPACLEEKIVRKFRRQP